MIIEDKIKCWCNNPEEEALQQARNITKLPNLFGDVCLMPDTHSGYGMPIGGVVALRNAISPNMVGVDIGCGMLAVRTNLTDISTEQLKEIMGKIRNTVPVGFNHHKEAQKNLIFEDDDWNNTIICKQEKESARYQIGTLGGGNHFIEIQKGDDGHIWFMIHSGSRNLGFKVANYYNKVAKEYCLKLGFDNIVKDELSFLTVGTEEAHNYIVEMMLCLNFSYQNRQMMSNQIKNAFKEVMEGVEFEKEINIHHNFASLENHNGHKVWVHRKGATKADKGVLGIIPSSQGTTSYIVEGRGNELSFSSCSHGSGRRLSRTQAKEVLNLEEERKKLDDLGIIHSIRNVQDLEEASSAYKDGETVMKEQEDLVKIVTKLRPLAVIKG